mgnify:CR=1
MSRSSDVNVPTGWWAAELHWNRGLFEVFNRMEAFCRHVPTPGTPA